MSKIRKYTPDRLIVVALASDYAIDNPDATSIAIKALFGLSREEMLGVASRVRSREAGNADAIKDAIEWAIVNNAGIFKIRNRYGFSESDSRRVSAAAKIANEKKLAEARRKLDVAIEYAIANPFTTVREVAFRFDVSFHSLERARAQHRKAIASDAATIADSDPNPQKPRRKTKDLHAVFADGSTVDCRRVKDWTNWIGFKEVVV